MEEKVTLGMTKDLRAKSEELTQEQIDNFVAETKKWIGREMPLDETASQKKVLKNVLFLHLFHRCCYKTIHANHQVTYQHLLHSHDFGK